VIFDWDKNTDYIHSMTGMSQISGNLQSDEKLLFIFVLLYWILLETRIFTIGNKSLHQLE